MKYLITLALLCCFWTSKATPSVYNTLAGVNRYWTEQKDIRQASLPVYKDRSDKEWIRLHLSLVEQTLRNRPTSGLSAAQQQHRLQALDHLHQYWITGNFPLNEKYSYRTPIFIDEHDNFCAVGYLVKATGHEAVSRMISDHSNLAYVMDMRYPELDAWADAYGFSKEELAWIQPTYPPVHSLSPLAGGTDGDVNELFAGSNGERLYVGGTFAEVGSDIAASNIAYITKSDNDTYSWHPMGSGVNGTVNAICEYNGKVFAGGAFSSAGGEGVNNIAYWENGAWHQAGCLYGTVHDLIVFNGELYAAGAFDVCAALSDVNLARWNGTSWSQIPGLSGQINAMEVMGNMLLLGGKINYQGNQVNVIGWSAVSVSDFHAFSNGIAGTVNDFETFKGVTYAVCDRADVTGTSPVLLRLDNNQWKPVYEEPGSDLFLPFNNKLSLNVLVTEGNTLLTGGNFIGGDMMSAITNSRDVTPAPYAPAGRHFYTDDVIHKMVVFKGDLVVGGNFSNGMTPEGLPIPVGGIAKRTATTVTHIPGLGAKMSLRLYPNPLSANSRLTIESDGSAQQLLLTDITGKAVYQASLQSSKKVQQVQLPSLAPAMYLVELSGASGEKYTQKLLLQ